MFHIFTEMFLCIAIFLCFWITSWNFCDKAWHSAVLLTSQVVQLY